MKKIAVIIFVFSISNCFAQSVNDYQYLVIPSLFSFQKSTNQYGIQSLAEAYFKEKGFAVLQEAAGLPTEINSNKCKAMYVLMTEKSSMFSTKIKVFIKDCDGKILAESNEGISNEKQYDLVYKQAVRAALTSFSDFKYSYQGKSELLMQPTPEKTLSYKELTEFKPKQAAVTENKYTISPVENPNYQVEQLANGFLIINKTTNTVFAKLFKTANPDVYIAKIGNLAGVASKSNGGLFLEFIENNILKSQTISVDLK
jgi:hypothetical protein